MVIKDLNSKVGDEFKGSDKEVVFEMSSLKFIFKDSSNFSCSFNGFNFGSFFKELKSVIETKNFNSEYASLVLPFEKSFLKDVKKIVGKLDDFNSMIVVGIGGSNLGAKSIYDLFISDSKSSLRNLFFLETLDIYFMRDLFSIVKERVSLGEKVVVNIVTKSGGTTETVLNFSLILSYLNKFGLKDLVEIIVTTSEDNDLWNYSGKNGFLRLSIPKMVGGRYSVFSAVGLLPLMFAGINVEGLISGAREFLTSSLMSESSSFLIESAKFIVGNYLVNEKKRDIFNQFFFVPKLSSIGMWYRQLLSESSGKEFSVNGKKVSEGLTPLISVGSTDLHSMVQLFLGKDFRFMHRFIDVINKPFSPISFDLSLLRSLGFIDIDEKLSVNDILIIIKKSVMKAFKERGIPFFEVQLKSFNEKSVGAFMQCLMLETILVCKLLNVNPFDQPNVEEYKKHISEYLKK